MSGCWQDHMEDRQGFILGGSTFKGTRLTVDHILGELRTGMSEVELLDDYPTLHPEHIRAALLHAAGLGAMDHTIFA